MVTEFHSNGSLGDVVLEKNKKFEVFNERCKEEGKLENQVFVGLNQRKVRLYLIDMLKALNYCHKVIKVIHRDIKPDNIMINHNDEAVLIDFGVSCLVGEDDELNNNMGSYIFYAPEMFMRSQGSKVRGEMTDIWALGVTLFYLLTGKYPAHGAPDLMALKDMITTAEPNWIEIKHMAAREIIQRMLVKDPDNRATLTEILESDWVTNSGQETIGLTTVDSPTRDIKASFGNINRFLKSKAMG